MTQSEFREAAAAHRRAADYFLSIMEPDMALSEMDKAVDAESRAALADAAEGLTEHVMDDEFSRTTAAIVRAKIIADERNLSLMLPLWRASIYGEPVAIYDRSGNLVGLGPQVALGETQPIIVRVSDVN